jgi:hypothetical protein
MNKTTRIITYLRMLMVSSLQSKDTDWQITLKTRSDYLLPTRSMYENKIIKPVKSCIKGSGVSKRVTGNEFD